MFLLVIFLFVNKSLVRNGGMNRKLTSLNFLFKLAFFYGNQAYPRILVSNNNKNNNNNNCNLRSSSNSYMAYVAWSRGSVLAFGTQVRGFETGRSCRIFQGEKIFNTPSFGG